MELNTNHWAALVFTVVAWVTGWYALVLVTADVKTQTVFPLEPTKSQLYGLIFSVFISVLVWLKNIYAIQGDTDEQGEE